MKNERLMSLDALRGFDMFFIMGLSSVIVALCALWPNAATDAIARSMGHVSWDGLRHHDTIFPLFLFLAGVSFPFSYAKQRDMGRSTLSIHLKIVRRAAMLIFLGLVYNGLFKLDFENLRCASVLARIGIAWMVAAILYVNCGLRTRAGISLFILIGYALLSKYVGAPDVPDADPLSRDGCLVGYVDRCLLPGHLYVDGRFDPEGLLSALPAVVTAMLGIFTGELIRLPEDRMSGGRKTLWMLAGAAVLAVAAVAGNGFVPVNKMLWSSTFVCAVGAYSLAMMALFYYVIDVRGWHGRLTSKLRVEDAGSVVADSRHQMSFVTLFRVVGMNSITIYMAQRIVGFSGISNFFFGGLAGLCSEKVAAVVTSSGYVIVCWLFLYFLYRKKVFLKI